MSFRRIVSGDGTQIWAGNTLCLPKRCGTCGRRLDDYDQCPVCDYEEHQRICERCGEPLPLDDEGNLCEECAFELDELAIDKED